MKRLQQQTLQKSKKLGHSGQAEPFIKGLEKQQFPPILLKFNNRVCWGKLRIRFVGATNV